MAPSDEYVTREGIEKLVEIANGMIDNGMYPGAERITEDAAERIVRDAGLYVKSPAEKGDNGTPRAGDRLIRAFHEALA